MAVSGPSWASRSLPATHAINVIAVGDSLTGGAGSVTVHGPQTYPAVLGTLLAAAYGGPSDACVSNQGNGGETIGDFASHAATIDALYDATKSQNILIVMGGTNNFTSAGQVPPALSSLASYIAARVATGWLVMINTIPDATAFDPGFDTQRLQFNQIIRSNFRSLGAFAYCDPGASVGMLVSGASDSLTYFQSDKIHPNATGFAAMAADVAVALKRTAVYL